MYAIRSYYDKKYAGERTFLEIGDDNVIREHCTFHRGTVQDQSLTKVGSRNLFMVNVHVAHDCIIGDNCILANNATLAGHVHIGDWVIFGGLAAIHQFGRVGSHAFVAGMAALNKDVPPYVMAAGHYAKPFGINSEGLRRRGFSPEAISAIKRAYKEIFRSGLTIEEVLPVLEDMTAIREINRPAGGGSGRARRHQPHAEADRGAADDAQEGPRAFAEKRKPQWKGR